MEARGRHVEDVYASADANDDAGCLKVTLLNKSDGLEFCVVRCCENRWLKFARPAIRSSDSLNTWVPGAAYPVNFVNKLWAFDLKRANRILGPFAARRVIVWVVEGIAQ